MPIGNRADNNELFFYGHQRGIADGGHGPHGVMAGWTGSGKTTMLRALIESLVLGHPPQNVQFLLADLKGGSGVKPFAGVPHVAQIITDLEQDQSLLGRFIDALQGEMARRKELCDLAGADDAGSTTRSGQINWPKAKQILCRRCRCWWWSLMSSPSCSG